MARVNPYFRELPGSYLFSEVGRRVEEHQAAHPGQKLIRLGIGDVTRPLVPAVTQAMARAVAEMGTPEGFHGYGPEQGYLFLREAIARHDYQARGVDISPEEIFISDGAKSDCGNIGELFAPNSKAAVCDPVYPAYVDAAALAGRAGKFHPENGRWSGLIYLNCVRENNFIPIPCQEKADMIFLCFPNNPTGMAATAEQLQAWVDYAHRTGAVLLFDAAYEAFITTPGIPHSIFEVAGARDCAIEFRSFSKTAGFTGTRCGYTVIPKELKCDGISLHSLWARRQAAKCNGVSYVVQRGAEAVYTPQGRAQIEENLVHYRTNAQTILDGLSAAGLAVWGGADSPYVWAETPGGQPSWSFFDRLLREAGVVTTPGVGFGPGGEGYLRLTGFGGAEETREAVGRIVSIL